MADLELDDVEALAEEASSRADEIEDGVAVPADLMHRIHESGLTRACLSAEYGGSDWAASQWLDAIIRLSAGNAAVGWVVAHVSVSNFILVAAGAEGQAADLLTDPHFQMAVSTAGMGTAKRAQSGWQVEGTWGFESGCPTATHIGGLVQVIDPSPGDPQTMLAFPERSNVQVKQDWDTVGLLGTGSHTATIAGHVVPDRFTMPAPIPLTVEVECRHPIRVIAKGAWGVATASAATQLGVAQRAVDELVTTAGTKVRPWSKTPQLEEQQTLLAVHRMRGRLQAAEAGLRNAIDNLWAAGIDERPVTFGDRYAVRLACYTAVDLGVDVVRTAYDLAGAGALHRGHPIARCHRDGTVLQQHISTNNQALETMGRIDLGSMKDNPLV